MAERTAGRLHIGVDARELSGRPTGVGRFLAGVLGAWSRDRAWPHQVSLFLPDEPPVWVSGLGRQFTALVDRPSLRGTLWEQWRLPRLARQARADVLLSPGYTAPLRLACPSVVVIHDVSFFAHPEWFHWREGLRRRWLTRASARRARRVISVSEFSAREIQRWLGIPAGQVVIVRHGAPEVTAAAGPRAPMVLFAGSLFNRRRLPELIEGFALAAARASEATLVLVGDNRTSPPLDPQALARRFGVGDRVEWRAYVSDDELKALYDRARVFAFLSDYEGFAMTPMEALAHGAPPVLLDTPVAHEVYGAAARYVRPEPEAIAAALVDLLQDDSARARLVDEGRRLLARYTWTQAGHDVCRVLEQAATGS